jgi:hypothetical protein
MPPWDMDNPTHRDSGGGECCWANIEMGVEFIQSQWTIPVIHLPPQSPQLNPQTIE